MPAAVPAVPSEARLMLALQDALGGTPAVAAARGLSAVGEHALGWFAIAAAGVVLDPARRDDWVRAGGAAFGAHATSVVLKRVVRRQRPVHDGLLVHARTPSSLSFPSSHASSTTAMAVAVMPLLGPALLPVAAAMALSRVLLGVHYPSDVVAGAAIGAAFGSVAARPRGRR